jgi:hypothetical protein
MLTVVTERVGVAVTLLPRIWVVLGSNIDPDKGYPEGFRDSP